MTSFTLMREAVLASRIFILHQICLCFNFNKDNFIYLQLMEVCVCPPWPKPQSAALCRCLFPQAGCTAFIPLPWLSPRSSDGCSRTTEI